MNINSLLHKGSSVLKERRIRTYKIDAVISNCSNNYGPRQFPEKLIPKMIYNILNNKHLPIYANVINIKKAIIVLFMAI